MIGNDIIDWQDVMANPRANNAKYVERILCKEEMQAFAQSAHPEQLLWSYWALKEAAYKAWYKNNHIRFFAPKKYCCRLNSDNNRLSAVVSTPFGLCFGVLAYHPDYIHAHVSTDKQFLKMLDVRIMTLSEKKREKQSLEIRNFVTKYVKETYNDLSTSVYLENTKEYLTIFSKNRNVDIHVSLSHHGRFGGVVLGKKG